jgi:hypothetical protein
VLKRLSSDDQLWVRERIRRHILNAILLERYGRHDLLPSRWLHESLIVSVSPLAGDRARFVEFTVSSDQLQLCTLDPAVRPRPWIAAGQNPRVPVKSYSSCKIRIRLSRRCCNCSILKPTPPAALC